MARPIRDLALLSVGGARRRHTLRDRSIAVVRRPARLALGKGRRTPRHLAGRARGRLHEATPSRHAPADDPSIVTLRGELHSRSAVDGLVHRMQAVPGVDGVECLVHLPGEPAPHNGRA